VDLFGRLVESNAALVQDLGAAETAMVATTGDSDEGASEGGAYLLPSALSLLRHLIEAAPLTKPHEEIPEAAVQPEAHVLPPLVAEFLRHAFAPCAAARETLSIAPAPRAWREKEAAAALWAASGAPEAVLREAVAAYEQAGCFDCADAVYAAAARSGVVRHWVRIDDDDDDDDDNMDELMTLGEGRNSGSHGKVARFAVDLHGFTAPLAATAIRAALVEHWETDGGEREDLVIITGKGLHSSSSSSSSSSVRGRFLTPVVRPEVQQMLIEQFNPPISTWTSPGNTGRLVVGFDAINAWVDESDAMRGLLMAKLRDLVVARAILATQEAALREKNSR